MRAQTYPSDPGDEYHNTLESALYKSGKALAPASSGSEVPIGSTSPPQPLMGSVEASDSPSTSQQGLNCKARRNRDLRGQLARTVFRGTMGGVDI